MSRLIDAQREAEALVAHMGLEPSRIGSDELTKRVFRTGILSVIESGSDTVAPSMIDLTVDPEV